jgi:hypothetical protein
MLLAQQCIANLRRILLEARKVHSRQDYARMAEPILLEVQRREQEILEYFEPKPRTADSQLAGRGRQAGALAHLPSPTFPIPRSMIGL